MDKPDKDKTDTDSPAAKPSPHHPANRDDQRFWQAMKTETPQADTPASNKGRPADAVDLTLDLADLTDDEIEHRRRALRSMLEASEARHNGALRGKRPTLAAGHRVRVRSGPLKGEEGLILDADYINSRCQLVVDSQEAAVWIEFARLGRTLKEIES